VRDGGDEGVLHAVELVQALVLGSREREQALTLGERASDDEEADGHERHEDLNDLNSLRRRMGFERHRSHDRAPGRDRPEQKGSGRGAQLSKADGSPKERGEDDVGVTPRTDEEDRSAEQGKKCQKGEPLHQDGSSRAASRGRKDDQEKGRDHQGADGVPEPPEEPTGRVGAVSVRPQRDDAGADRRAYERADARPQNYEEEDVADASEPGIEAKAAEKVGASEGFERVAN
jgi:hypothetical protein